MESCRQCDADRRDHRRDGGMHQLPRISQNLEDQMTQTAENLSCAAAAQVTAESKAGDAGLRRLSADEYEHAEHAGAGAIQPRAGSHQNVSVFGVAALWRGAAGGDGYRHNRLHAAGADGAAAGGERRQVGYRKAGGRRRCPESRRVTGSSLTRGGWNTCARRRQRCLFWRCRSQICSRRRAWQPPEDRWKC